MKKSIILIFLSLLTFLPIINAEEVCGPENEKYNPLTWSNEKNDEAWNKQDLTYEITYTKVANNKFYLDGFAFIKNMENTMGPGDTTIELVAAQKESDINSGNYIPFEVRYTTLSDNNTSGKNLLGAHYFDITYWNCYRKSFSSGNQCFQNNAHIKGGFEATLDFKDSRFKTGTYNIFMKINSSNSNVFASLKDTSRSRALNKWFKVGAPDNIADSSSKNGTEVNVDGTKFKLTQYSTKATVIVSSGRITGPSGFFCDSVAKSNKSATYFKSIDHEIYSDEPVINTYRGENSAENYMHLYPLNVSSYKNVNKDASGKAIGYAPSSWLNFIGNIQIVVNKGRCDPTTECCFDSTGKYVENYKGEEEKNYRCSLSTITAGNNCPSNSVISCKKNPTDCTDNVESAVCDVSDPINESGTHSVFHENDNLSSCTLDDTKKSGFTLLKTNYCSVACKDDIDAYLPTYRTNIAAGTYFDLTYYIDEFKELAPTLSIKRTCVTSKIDHDKFESDLESYAKNTLIPAYNNWQDMLDIYNFLMTDEASEDPSDRTSGSCSYDCPDPGEEGSCSEETYTIYKWDIYKRNALNYTSNNYSGENDTYYSSSHCGSKSSTYSTSLANARSTYKTKETNARATYKQALNYYNSIIANYNMCYNWTNETNNVSYETSGTDLKETYKLKTGTANFTNSYSLKFSPDVTFDYTDKSNVFGNNYTYKYNAYNGDIEAYAISYNGSDDSKLNNDNKTNSWYSGTISGGTKTLHSYYASPLTNLIYWNNSTQSNENYSSVNPITSLTESEKENNNCTKSGSNCKTIKLYNCTGNNCNNSNTYELSINTRDYIKRTEELTYEYHLPRVITKIPDGSVKNAGSYLSFNSNYLSYNYLLLDEESVPININTESGVKNYTITIENIEDGVRQVIDSANDNFKERFNGVDASSKKALNSDGTTSSARYVCTYEVVNDIYDPNAKKDLFFYRVIDMNDINPNASIGRELGYNWTTPYAYEIQDKMKDEDNNYQYLTNDRETDKFSFRLTPTMMSAIREYNAERNSRSLGGYADWELYCKDNGEKDYYCYSNFLKCLTSSGHSNETGFYYCDNLFNSYSHTYTDIDLNKNRGILKSKVGG